MAKKPLLSPPSNAQLVSSCREVQNLAVEGRRDDYLVWMNAQNIFFPAAYKLNWIMFGGWTGSCTPGDKNFNVSDASTLYMVRVIEGESILKRSERKQNLLGPSGRFELSRLKLQ